MSIDLWVWKAPAYTLKTINYGIARFDGGDLSAFEASPDVAAFHAELMEQFPPREEVPLDQIDAIAFTPWASTPLPSDRMVAMSLSWKMRDEQLEAVLRLVDRHRLWLYDPQRALVKPPEGTRSASGWRRWLPGARRPAP